MTRCSCGLYGLCPPQYPRCPEQSEYADEDWEIPEEAIEEESDDEAQ